MIIYCANIRVVYLPPKNTPLLKPINEGVISYFQGRLLVKNFQTVEATRRG
jgi:hypothetical protein